MSYRPGFKIPDWPRGRPTVDQVKPLVDFLYDTPHGGAGGCLHVVLDDGNMAEKFIRACRDSARVNGCVLCEVIADLMLQMSPTQRRRL